MKTVHDEQNKQFQLWDDEGEQVGYLAYEVADDGALRALTTKVFPAFEGKGYARQLLDAIVEYARKQGVKIVPVCSYVDAAFKKRPDQYADVMA